jgi:hypothetical protein
MAEPVAAPGARPSRADLRRAAEAQTSAEMPTPEPASRSRHARSGEGHSRTSSAASSGASRLEQRRIAEARRRAARSSRALWKAWWVYPLVAAILLTLWLGIQSTSRTPVRAPSVVTTISTEP